MAKIPREDKAVDGVSTVPGRALVNYVDWEALKREFILQDEYPRVATWLARAKGWSQKRIMNGSTRSRVVGWPTERAQFQHKKTQQAYADALEEERKMLPLLRKAKLQLVLSAIKGAGNYHNMEPAEQRMLYHIIKTELGEPESIKVQGIVSAKDPVEAILENFGLMENGLILDGAFEESEEIIDAIDEEDNRQLGSGSSNTPAEVSPS